MVKPVDGGCELAPLAGDVSNQVTRYYYDRSLRLTNTIQPDNTGVTHVYDPSGALWKVLGARTCLRG